MVIRTVSGCRDCALCTGNAFTGFGRVWGRIGADVATLGVTNIARRKCKACAHPMAEHHVQAQQVVIMQQPYQQPMYQQPRQLPSGPPPGWYADPFDGQAQTWWDGSRWLPETKRAKPRQP